MYLLERGRVKLIRQSSDRRVQLLSIHAYGEVLGEIPVFDPHGGPRTASAVSMTMARASYGWSMTPCSHGLMSIRVWPSTCCRSWPAACAATTSASPSLVFMDVPARLAKTLLNLGSRFGEPVEQGLKVPHDLTQEELAQLVGSSRVRR